MFVYNKHLFVNVLQHSAMNCTLTHCHKRLSHISLQERWNVSLNKGKWHKANSSDSTIQGDLTTRQDIDELLSLIVKGCYTGWRPGLVSLLPDFAHFPVMNSRYNVSATIRTKSCEMNSSGSGQGPVARSCEHGNENTGPENLWNRGVQIPGAKSPVD
jgi:hypothetical protein